MSQQIKRLELETKRPLFRRTTRSVALTDDGEMLLGDARRLLQLEEAARHRLAAPRLFGTVRLGVVEEVAGGSLPSALGRFDGNSAISSNTATGFSKQRKKNWLPSSNGSKSFARRTDRSELRSCRILSISF